MAEDEEVSAARTHLERAFEHIAEAMKQAARQRNYQIASSEAEHCGLVETPVTKVLVTAWQRTDRDLALRFRWRYYDQSGPFSIQKDMNVLSLELRHGNEVLRQTEERYED
jgi:hypothetical protein